ncbi:MAG: hypothetical protein KDJ65_38515, partial [Anaerolineae bacterium]|nr:hypothetical protein [Anaerolineae bacterium]
MLIFSNRSGMSSFGFAQDMLRGVFAEKSPNNEHLHAKIEGDFSSQARRNDMSSEISTEPKPTQWAASPTFWLLTAPY